MQAAANASYHARTLADPNAAERGVRRFDFLGGRVLFAGLRPRQGRSGEFDAMFVAF
jgi:hypothetical protein